MNGMDIMDSEKTRGFHFPCHGRNQSGHPIIAVNEIRTYMGYDVIDDLPLESEGDFDVFHRIIGVHTVKIKKCPVFGEMNSIFRYFALDDIQLSPEYGP